MGNQNTAQIPMERHGELRPAPKVGEVTPLQILAYLAPGFPGQIALQLFATLCSQTGHSTSTDSTIDPDRQCTMIRAPHFAFALTMANAHSGSAIVAEFDDARKRA